MTESPTTFKRIASKALNSRQKENFNFQKVSAVLADYGFTTLRLSDDWQGADFIANHIDGDLFLKVQLKSRLTLDKKYKNKDIWICFEYQVIWYLVLHDAFLRWALENLDFGNTPTWGMKGFYHWPTLSKVILSRLSEYALTDDPAGPAQEALKSG